MSDTISNTLKPFLRQPVKQAGNKQYIPEDYKAFAREREKEFAKEMLKHMNRTIGADEGDTGSQYYRSLLDDKRADMLTENNGGLGIQDVILDQIYPHRQRNPIAYQAYLNQQQMRQKGIFQQEKVQMKNESSNESIQMHDPASKIEMKNSQPSRKIEMGVPAKEAPNE